MRSRTGRVVLVALGIGLALAPLIFNMFERAPKGADMLNDFRPYMTQEKIGTFQRYMREIDAGVDETDSGLRPYLAEHAGIDQAQFDTRFATFVSFSKTWPVRCGSARSSVQRTKRRS